MYTFVIEGKIKPYVRMTRRGKFVKPQAIEYLNSKETLAWQFREQMTGHVKLEKTPLRVVITLHVKRLHHCDLDNQIKAVLDAMNGIVYGDDRWVDHVSATRSKAGSYTTEVTVEPLL